MIAGRRVITLFVSCLLVFTHIAPADGAVKTKPRKCPKISFVGFRGSGQNYQLSKKPTEIEKLVNELGPELSSLYLNLSKRAKLKKNIGWARLNTLDSKTTYEAVPLELSNSYIDSISIRATSAVDKLFNNYAAKCESDTRFIVTGFSQGAFVAHKLIINIENSKPQLAKRIIAALFLADPGKSDTGIVQTAWEFNNDSKYSVAKTALDKCPTVSFVDMKTRQICTTISSVLDHASESELRLNNPASVPFLYLQDPYDIVSDTSTWLSRALDILTSNFIFNGLKSLDSWIVEGARVHGSYCPISGPIILIATGPNCNDLSNKDYILRATNFIESNLG